MSKFNTLESFIEQYKHLPEQGTDEWKLLRKDFIGGSEVASILKQNKNKSISKLILGKLGFDPFRGNSITHWGNVFEECCRLYCEDEFACTIRETGSIPYTHGNLSYSPDGLAVVSTDTLNKKFGTEFETNYEPTENQLVLFEFKCPHTRVPSTEIPEHYMPQINIGMNIIDIMETGIFVQATYRRCSFVNLKYNRAHNNSGHFKQVDTTEPPVEWGVMVLYIEEDSDYNREELIDELLSSGGAEEIELPNGESVVDLGGVYEADLLEEVLGRCVNKSFKVDYSIRGKFSKGVFTRPNSIKKIFNASMRYKTEVELCIQHRKYSRIIGVMPYKMMNVHVTPVVKNPNYIQDTGAYDKAIEVLNCIRDHKDMDDKKEISKSIRRYKL